MNNLFNDQSLEQIDRYEWVVADLARGDFGETVKDAGHREWDHLKRFWAGRPLMGRKFLWSESMLKWQKPHDESKGDGRLLGYFTDGQGRRHLQC